MSERPKFRKTKIIATVGPACDDVETLTRMIHSGMNVARLNLSHGTFDEHAARVQRIREAAGAAGSRVAIMIDTRGIEIRTGLLRSSYADLSRGAGFILRTDGRPGDETGVSVSYPKLPREVTVEDHGYLQKIPFHSANVVTEAISGAVATMAKDLKAAAIISRNIA